MAAAIAVNVAIFAALAVSAPGIVIKIRDRVLTTTNIPVAPPPEPIPIKPEPAAASKHSVAPPIDRINPIVESGPIMQAFPPLPPSPPFLPGDGLGTARIEPAAHVPVMTDPAIDQRFARDFQPDYPAGERRLENEGKVVIRVLVGADGRVRQAERVSAASDAFWRATERQALTRWRFTPATRDGTPIEAWRTLTVRFEMTS